MEPSNNTSKSLIKIGDAAQLLGVSIDTLRRWEKKGKIQCIKTPGGTRLYSVDALRKYQLANNKKENSEVEGELASTPLKPIKIPLIILTILVIFILITASIVGGYYFMPNQTKALFRPQTQTNVLGASTDGQSLTNKNANIFSNLVAWVLSPFNKIAEQTFIVMFHQRADAINLYHKNDIQVLSKKLNDVQGNLIDALSQQQDQNSKFIKIGSNIKVGDINIHRLIAYDGFIGLTTIDSLGNVYPTLSSKGRPAGSLGITDRKYSEIFIDGLSVSQGGVELGREAGTNVKFLGDLGSNIIPGKSNEYTLGNDNKYFKQAYINNINSNTVNTSTLNASNITLTNSLAIGGPLTPLSDNSYDIGTSALKWRDLYLSRNALINGSLTVSANQTVSGNTTLGGSVSINGATNIASTLNVVSAITGASLNLATGTLTAGAGSFTSITNSGSYTQSGLAANTFNGDSTFNNNLVVNGNTTLGDTSTDSLAINSRLTTSLVPRTDGAIDLGCLTCGISSTPLRFNNIYVNSLQAAGTSTSGQATFTYTPPSSTIGSSTVWINPTTATAVRPLLGLSVGGIEKARITTDGYLGLGGANDPSSSYLINGGVNFNVTPAGALVATSLNLGSGGAITSGLINSQTISSAASFTGTVAVATSLSINSGTALTTTNQTGTGSIVMSTSPTLTTPTISSPTITTSLTTPLVIGGTTNTSTLTLRSTSGNGASGADIIFQTGNNGATEAMRILNSGNVGIGTSVPNYKLDVNGGSMASQMRIGSSSSDSGAYLTSTNASDGYFSQGAAFNGSNWVAKSTAATIIGGGSGGLSFYGNSGLTAGNTFTPNLRFTVDGSGNVGIGTSSPQGKLDLVGPSGVTSFTGTTALGLRVRGSSSTNDYSGIDFSGNNDSSAIPYARIAAITTASGSSLRFGTSNSYASGITNTAMSIDPSGNVGIGTTAPEALFDARGLSLLGPTTNRLTIGGVMPLSEKGLWISYGATTADKVTIQAEQQGISYRDILLNPSGGNVGIGTTNPQSLLDVQGNARFGSKIGIIVDATPGNTLKVVGSLCVKDVGGACGGTSGGTIYATNTTVQAADLAENYVSADTLEPGDLVTPSADGDNQAVIKSSGIVYQTQVIGVISTKPGVVLNSDAKVDINHPNLYPVALSGRVPVKFSTENGDIKAGDFLTASSTPGIAMKATKIGTVIGKALEDFDQTKCTINLNEGCMGKVLVFINVSFADPNNILAQLYIQSDGTIVAPKLKTASLTISPNLVIGNEQGGGGSFSTTVTNNNSQALAIEVASKLASIDSNIATQSAQLADLNNKVNGVATESANLSAKSEELSNKLTFQSADIASQSASLAELNSKYQLLDSKLTAPNIMYATESATLAKLNVTDTISTLKLDAIDATISGTLKSLGNSFLGNTTIAGDLTVDGTTSISGSSLSSIGTLFLQNNPLAQNLDIFNGLVTIDNTGTIKTKALAVTGPSVGKAKITSGQTKVTINLSLLTANSMVFITSLTPIDKPLAVTNIRPGESFDVSITTAPVGDIEFNYWVVENK